MQQTFQAEQLSSHDPALAAFSLGYLALFKEHTTDAIHHFQEGIAVCSNDALNNDIKRVITQVENAVINSSLAMPTSTTETTQPNPTVQAQTESINTATEQKKLTGFLGAYLDTINEDNGSH
jgi:thioesterase domain-containing protein